MRKYHGWKEDGKPYPTTFTDERIARLNVLGFEWRLKDTPMKAAMKPEAGSTTPSATRLPIDSNPLQQFQQGVIPLNIGNNSTDDGNNNDNKQNWNNWGGWNGGFDQGSHV